MAISVKVLRTGTQNLNNVFVVTAGSGDSGKLQIQYNDSDIYNNLSGTTSDILSGQSNTTITVPLDANNNIKKGKYYFNFVADVGTSDTHTINFQVDSRSPLIVSDTDVYAPSFRVDDETSYLVDNGTVSAASRTLTVQYPTGSNQPNIVVSAASTTTDLYVTTSNVWTGAMQTTLSYDVTYSIAATTGFDAFVYQESGIGYDNEPISITNSLQDVYDCIESLRVQVYDAATKRRSDYAQLLSNYTYVCSLALQFREAVTNNKTAALDDIIRQIKFITNCQGSSAQDPSAPSRKIYGIGGSSESIQDIVGDMFVNAIPQGVVATYNDNLATISLEGRALYLHVYNDTGSAISKGKAVYVSGYDSTTGLPEVSLADNTSASTARAIGLVSDDIASAASGKALVYGWFEEVNTLSYSVGDRLFLSTSGNLTNTDPGVNAESQLIATVIKDATAGALLVSPQRSVNLNSLVASTTTVTELIGNFTRAVVTLSAGQIAQLDSDSVEIIPGGSGRIIQIHSAQLYLDIAPSAGTQVVDFTLLSDTASGNAYSANRAVWRSGGVSSTVAATYPTTGSYALAPIVSNSISAATVAGNGIYLSNADGGGNYSEWNSSTGKVVVFYSSYPTSIS